MRSLLSTLFVSVLASVGADAAPPAPADQQTVAGMLRSPAEILNRQLPSWVRLSGELRAREEGFYGDHFEPGRDDMYLLQRVRLGVQVTPAPWLQMFVQGQDARVSFTERIPAAPPYQDSADLRQAWVQFGSGEKGGVNLRVGRQELMFGEERLVGAGNWGNVSRTFDAVRLGLRHRGYSVDAFASSVVVARDHAFDRHVDGDNLHGMYGGIDGWVPNGRLEPFVFWRVAPSGRTESGVRGRLDTKTAGIRWAGKLPHAFEYTTEMALQRGSWAGDSASSWAGFWRLGRTFNNLRWKPLVRLELNHASGDRNPRDGRHGTFEVLYPTPHDKYGLTDQVGWKNVYHVGLIGELRLAKTLTLVLKGHDRWLASATDGLYNAGGTLLVRDPSGSSGRHIGKEVDFLLLWAMPPRVQLGGGIGHMFAGEFIKRTTPGSGYTFPYVMLTYTL